LSAPAAWEKRALQFCVVLGGFVPVGAGLAGIWLGPKFAGPVGDPSVSLVSHFSYLSGLLLAIGLAFWSTLPEIERRTGRFRLLTAIVFVGGLSRAVTLLRFGAPDAPMLFGLTMELVVTPALALWQARLARPSAPTM
jgi:hypothetical protein